MADKETWKEQALRHCNRADRAEAEVERLTSGPDVCVFIRTHGDRWFRWDKSFEEVVVAMTERKQTEAPTHEPTVVVEVRAMRKARVRTLVHVEHYINEDGEEVLQ